MLIKINAFGLHFFICSKFELFKFSS